MTRTGRPRTKPPPNAIDRAVGKRIQEKRQAAGLTQAELARKIKKSASTLYRYETGDLCIRVTMATKIAGILGCQAADLMEGTNK